MKKCETCEKETDNDDYQCPECYKKSEELYNILANKSKEQLIKEETAVLILIAILKEQYLNEEIIKIIFKDKKEKIQNLIENYIYHETEINIHYIANQSLKAVNLKDYQITIYEQKSINTGSLYDSGADYRRCRECGTDIQKLPYYYYFCTKCYQKINNFTFTYQTKKCTSCGAEMNKYPLEHHICKKCYHKFND
ncbi:MAG: hypothetical protein LBT30_07845 [Clostridiales bacterium]|nr:hypothetical protein [Clostridiales bacterium]